MIPADSLGPAKGVIYLNIEHCAFWADWYDPAEMKRSDYKEARLCDMLLNYTTAGIYSALCERIKKTVYYNLPFFPVGTGPLDTY